MSGSKKSDQVWFQKVLIIGLGLIGGSIARKLKSKNPNIIIDAYGSNENSMLQALKDGNINHYFEDFPEELNYDLIILAAPTLKNIEYLEILAPKIKKSKTLIIDISSTKQDIVEKAKKVGLADNFIGAHPMAGSEKTRYENSSEILLDNAFFLLTPEKVTKSKDEDKEDANISKVESFVQYLQAIPLVLDPKLHDKIVAAISHLPHIIASALVNVVAQNDQNFQFRKLAAGGFKDITRIASSSPEIWENILRSNSQEILEILPEFQSQLDKFAKQLKLAQKKTNETKDEVLLDLFANAKKYRDLIEDNRRNLVLDTDKLNQPREFSEYDFSFTVNIPDEVGQIAKISQILAENELSIRNIGINNNREEGEGILRIQFYEDKAKQEAQKVLAQAKFEVFN